MSSTPINVMATTGLTKEAKAKIIQRYKAIEAIADEIKPASEVDLLQAADAESTDVSAPPAVVTPSGTTVSTEERMFWTLCFNQGSLSNLGIQGLFYDAKDLEQNMTFTLVSAEAAKKFKILLTHKYGIKAEEMILINEEEEEENTCQLALTSGALDKLLTKAAVMPGVRDENILDSIASLHVTIAYQEILELQTSASDDGTGYDAKFCQSKARYLDKLIKNRFFADFKQKIDELLTVEGSANTSASPMAAPHLLSEGPQEAAKKLLAQRVGLRSITKRKLDDIGFKLAGDDEDVDYDYQFTIKHRETTDTFSVNGYAYTIEEDDSSKLQRAGYGFDQAQVRFEGALTQENARNLVILSVMRLLTCQEVKEGWKLHAYKYTLTCDSKNKEFVKQFINEAIKVGANVQLVGAAKRKFAESKQVNKLLLKAKKQHEKCMASNDGYGAPPARTYKEMMLSLLHAVVYYMTFKRFCKPEDDLDFIAEEASSAVKVHAVADTRIDEKDADDHSDYSSEASDENEDDRDAELDGELRDLDDDGPAAVAVDSTPVVDAAAGVTTSAADPAIGGDVLPPAEGAKSSGGVVGWLFGAPRAEPSSAAPAQDDDLSDEEEDTYDFRGMM